MFVKKFLTYSIYTLLIALCVFVSKAHWVDDPGPVLVEGDEKNLSDNSGRSPNGRWKSWDLSKEIKDSENNSTLSAQVYHKKEIKWGLVDKAEGVAYCQVWAAISVSDEYTKGKYDVHARARGRWMYSNNRKKNSYFAGVTSQAEKDAGRYHFKDGTTYSGVHLKGKAHINSQVGDIKLQLNWL